MITNVILENNICLLKPDFAVGIVMKGKKAIKTGV
jgi:hypothetical protein